jgi:hypothetical protein
MVFPEAEKRDNFRVGGKRPTAINALAPTAIFWSQLRKQKPTKFIGLG